MNTIPTVSLTKTTKVDDDDYCTEASTLGLRPGFWPMEIQTSSGLVLRRICLECTHAEYAAPIGENRLFRVTVFND